MNAQAALKDSHDTKLEKDLRPMANAIRALSMDAVEKANSGHPGMPMGMADVATVLYSKYMKFYAAVPNWADRDRFVLSAGHGSMLLYSILYLTGYKEMTLDEIKRFRQLGSKTPGHPEVEQDLGIETTTGPLGQGISNAVGMALAERIMNNRFNDELVDHYTYVIAGDGDLMEGISHEACELAGHLKLSRLIVLYDDNEITIDGPTSLSYSGDATKRFEAYGWDVQEIDGHNYAAIDAAIAKARTTDKPSIIRCKTKIGFGAPTKEGKSSSHGAPLGEKEIEGARKNLGWDHAPFEIPGDILDEWRRIGARHEGNYSAWKQRLDDNRVKDEFLDILAGDVSKIIAPEILKVKEKFVKDAPKMATRKTSGAVLDALVPALPQLVGGSADLTGSNITKVDGPEVITPENNYNGQYIYYGVREHGMASAMNGMALHGGVIPYGGTFLTFSDYSRPAIRLSALMKQRTIHVMTHDSIGLGEDGPTHQPVEHLAALRAIPNLLVMRPCDGVETAECWQIALDTQEGPSLFALTRQGLPTVRTDATEENKCAKGAYILSETKEGEEPDVTLFASGSEVEIIIEAAKTLEKDGANVRVVSVPCMELFKQQSSEYQMNLLCNKSVKVAVEAGVRQGWDYFIGGHSAFIGMNGFGDSAPAEVLYKHFGITAEAVVKAAKDKLTKTKAC